MGELNLFDGLFGCASSTCGMRPSKIDGYQCDQCGRVIAKRNGILIDSATPFDITNHLETIDYDGTHGVSVGASEQLGLGYAAFIRPKFDPDRFERLTVLEIGGGSGGLSLGLALSFPFARLLVTDVSVGFTAINLHRMRQNVPAERSAWLADHIEFLTCSIDNMPLRAGEIDLIVGNSVLHHIYDYAGALSGFCRLLRPGGWVVLSEPVIQGKAPIGLACRLIAELDRQSELPRFTVAEQKLLRDLATMCTRGFWRATAETNRDTADDKHLFDAAEMVDLGRRTGFTWADAVSVMPVETSFVDQLQGALRMMGVRPEPLASYGYVLDAITQQLLVEMPEAFCATHAFLSFFKA